jgi:putative tryptophan/tyrosine transport system substrate-binding protein
MRRRDFITLLGSLSVTWPLVTRAQQVAMPKIGFLHVASAKPFEGIVAGFRQGLKQVGYTEHENVSIEFRWAEGDYGRLPALAAELVRLKVAVIVTGGGEASALAAKAATRTIPIICNLATDPVKTGLVAALSHPGGNITGVNILTTDMAAKRVALLHDLLPASSVIAHLVNPNFAATEDAIKEVEIAAGHLGLTIVLLKASSESDIDAAFALIQEKRIGALLVNSDAFFNSRRDQFVALAARDAVPAVFAQREFAVAGGLMSYGTNLTDSYRQMGNYAGRILKGERPADLPVVQSAKFELVINLKTAKSLGLTVPSGLLNAAEVIE